MSEYKNSSSVLDTSSRSSDVNSQFSEIKAENPDEYSEEDLIHQNYLINSMTCAVLSDCDSENKHEMERPSVNPYSLQRDCLPSISVAKPIFPQERRRQSMPNTSEFLQKNLNSKTTNIRNPSIFNYGTQASSLCPHRRGAHPEFFNICDKAYASHQSSEPFSRHRSQTVKRRGSLPEYLDMINSSARSQMRAAELFTGHPKEGFAYCQTAIGPERTNITFFTKDISQLESFNRRLSSCNSSASVSPNQSLIDFSLQSESPAKYDRMQHTSELCSSMSSVALQSTKTNGRRATIPDLMNRHGLEPFSHHKKKKPLPPVIGCWYPIPPKYPDINPSLPILNGEDFCKE